MTEDQYKEGLLALLNIFQEIDDAETFQEIDKLTICGSSMIRQALDSLEKEKGVLH